MNKLFNGQGNVVIKSKSDRTILGKSYGVDDIITYLEDVRITLAYNEVNQKATKEGNLLALRSDAFPSTVIVDEIKNTSALNKLLYSPTDKVVEMTVAQKFDKKELDNNGGLVYLNLGVDDIVSYSKVKSYSNTGEKVDYVLDETKGTLTFSDYDEYDYVRVFVTVTTNSQALAMEKNASEYIYMELQLEGRLGIYQGHFVVNIPAAQLVSSPQYEFEDGGLQYGNQLVFTIMNVNINKPVLAFIRG